MPDMSDIEPTDEVVIPPTEVSAPSLPEGQVARPALLIVTGEQILGEGVVKYYNINEAEGTITVVFEDGTTADHDINETIICLENPTA